MMKTSLFVVVLLGGTAALAHADPSIAHALVTLHNHLFHLFQNLVR
jgi:hypothetical protein